VVVVGQHSNLEWSFSPGSGQKPSAKALGIRRQGRAEHNHYSIQFLSVKALPSFHIMSTQLTPEQLRLRETITQAYSRLYQRLSNWENVSDSVMNSMIRDLEQIHEFISTCSPFEFEMIFKYFVGTLTSRLFPQKHLKITMTYLKLLNKFYKIFTHKTTPACPRESCADCLRIQEIGDTKARKLRQHLLEFACFKRQLLTQAQSVQSIFDNNGHLMDDNSKKQFDINHLLNMLGSPLLSGENISEVLQFLIPCLELLLKNQSDPRRAVKVLAAAPLYRLVLDPLVIVNVRNNEPFRLEYNEKTSIPTILPSESLEVVWSDGRTDTSEISISSRTDGMEVFKLLISLLTPDEMKVHLEGFEFEVSSNKLYLEAPYRSHLDQRIPEVLGWLMSNGRLGPHEDRLDPLISLLRIISFLQERSENDHSPLVSNTLRIVFRDSPLSNAATIFKPITEFIINLIHKNRLSVDQLRNCSECCLIYLSNLVQMQDLSKIAHLGAILCVLLTHLKIRDRDFTINIPFELIWIWIKEYRVMKLIECSEIVQTTLDHLAAGAVNLEINERNASACICIYFLDYAIHQPSRYDLVCLLLKEFADLPFSNSHDCLNLILLAMKVIQSEWTMHLFQDRLKSNDISNILSLAFAASAANCLPCWDICTLAFDLLSGMCVLSLSFLYHHISRNVFSPLPQEYSSLSPRETLCRSS
jgi:hypothetical protein